MKNLFSFLAVCFFVSVVYVPQGFASNDEIDRTSLIKKIEKLESEVTKLIENQRQLQRKYIDLVKTVYEDSLIKVQCNCERGDDVIGKGKNKFEAIHNANAICEDPQAVGQLKFNEKLVTNCTLSSGVLGLNGGRN